MLTKFRPLSLFVTLALLFYGCGNKTELSFKTSHLSISAVLIGDQVAETSQEYRLERPVVVSENGRALALRIWTDASSVFVEIMNRGEVVEEIDLHPPGRGPVEFRHPIEKGFRMDGMRLSIEDKGSSVDLLSAGFSSILPGAIIDTLPILSTTIPVTWNFGNPHKEYTIDLSAFLRSNQSPIQNIEMKYSYDDGMVGDADIETPIVVRVDGREDGITASFQLIPRPGGKLVHLYHGAIGFNPQIIHITSHDPSFELSYVMVRPVPLERDDGSLVPMPADLGAIIAYDRRYWRRERFELFTWNLVPKVLVFDFRDYETQSRYLKRLAFFVEKKGSAGTIHPNHIIERLHGWNAHDYGSIDLARFYNEARFVGFRLNTEEEELARLLVREGILVQSGSVFQPGEGGILSLTQESPLYLRKLLMNHEGYHGLFFVNGDYQEAVNNIWQELSPTERGFWLDFLDWKFYDINDRFLVVNEFQAYLMQQSSRVVNGYYKSSVIPRFLAERPRSESLIQKLLADYPDTFVFSQIAVQRAALSTVGIGAADLLCLTPLADE